VGDDDQLRRQVRYRIAVSVHKNLQCSTHAQPGPGACVTSPTSCARPDAVRIDQIRKYGLYDDIWQAFAVLLPVKTVGVMGYGRTYDFVVGLRAVTSTHGMTADFYQFDMKFLGETATRDGFAISRRGNFFAFTLRKCTKVNIVAPFPGGRK
jgi:GMP synthase PP-ATPase subunit